MDRAVGYEEARAQVTMHVVDTHCHLAFPSYDEDRAEVVRRARESHVVACIVVAVDAATAHAAQRLSEEQPGWAFATAGLHPTEPSAGDDAAHATIANLVRGGHFVAVGETGLDAFHDSVPMDTQIWSMHRQIKLAVELDLPVILHCRDAFNELVSELRSWRYSGLRGVVHCFTGNLANAGDVLDAGLHIGIGGIATFKASADLRDVIRAIPVERLLLETDAPWLAPAPMRGRRNEPAFVTHIAASVANTLNIAPHVLARTTTQNAMALFRLQGRT